MSLVFTGEHAAFDRQCFKMVDMLINHFEHTMFGLTPCAVPYVPRMEGNKVNAKEEGKGSKYTKYERINKLLEGNDFG